MIGRLAAALREWLLAELMLCPQCGCLADRRHGSGACGRFVRDTVTELQREERAILRRLRTLEETQSAHANQLQDLSALTDDPFREETCSPYKPVCET